MPRKRAPPSPTTGTYRCRSAPLRGHRYADIMPQARTLFRTLEKRTRRRPYVRSAYFQRDKIFFEYFWTHLQGKSLPDRTRRLRYLPCVLEVLRATRHPPRTFIDAQEPGIIRHQFRGRAPDGSFFAVIVKQDRSSGRKNLLSIFPLEE